METKEQELATLQPYLTFFLGGDEYSVNVHQVKEIIDYVPITKVPKMPSWVRGVINLRGSVVPVVDLALRFGFDERPVTKTTCIIVVEVHQETEMMVMGLIADAVDQVLELAAGDIEQPPDFGTKVRLEYLAGM